MPARDDFHRNLTGTLKLDFPLFLGFKTFGAVQRATAELRQAEYQREALLRQVGVEVERARQEVRRTLAELGARRGTAQLSEKAYKIATVRYANGIATPLELSDARLQLQTSEVNEVQAIKDYFAALAGLEFALGRDVPTAPLPLDQLPTPVEDEVNR
jgi:outer membrane protein TolC